MHTKLSEKQFQTMVDNHTVWLNTRGHEGKRADFTNCDLSLHNFDGLNLARAIFVNTLFIKTDLRHTVLTESNFTDAYLYHVNFSGNILKSVNFCRATFHSVSMENCQCISTHFDDIVLYSKEHWLWRGCSKYINTQKCSYNTGISKDNPINYRIFFPNNIGYVVLNDQSVSNNNRFNCYDENTRTYSYQEEALHVVPAYTLDKLYELYNDDDIVTEVVLIKPSVHSSVLGRASCSEISVVRTLGPLIDVYK